MMASVARARATLRVRGGGGRQQRKQSLKLKVYVHISSPWTLALNPATLWREVRVRFYCLNT